MPIFLVILLSFGRLTGAVDVDYDIQGNIYVVDREADALVKYGPHGDSLRAVSGFGRGSLQFDGPVAVYARRGNDVYVADQNNHRIQRFNRTLDLVATFSTRDDADERRRFGYPRDVAVTREGELIIVDGENRRIVVLDGLGGAVRTFGDQNAGAGRLLDPLQVEVDAASNVYVLDTGRIVQFDPFGSFVRSIPVVAHGGPVSISVDRDTLTVLHDGRFTLYDLATVSEIVTLTAAGAPLAARYGDARFLCLEPTRVTLVGSGSRGEK